jgi:hypothetical protein
VSKSGDDQQFFSTVEGLTFQFGNGTKQTTNYVWTVPHEQQIMVFFPNHTIYQNEIYESITSIVKLCQDCSCHSFYVGKNQLMEAGVYLAIYNEQKNGRYIFERINEYRKTIVDRNIRENIRMSFPYKTLYFEGLYIGGEAIFKELLPYYEAVSSFVFESIVDGGTNEKRNVLVLLATDFLLQFTEKISDYHKFLNDYCELLLPEVIDPNALYNINQLSDIKETTLGYYESIFIKNKSQLSKLQTADEGIAETIEAYNGVFDIVTRDTDSSTSPLPMWNAENIRHTLRTHIINHVLSLFHLNSMERFSIAYNVARLLA